MSTILAKDITLERLHAAFVANNVPARIIEYFPATKDSPRDAVLSVDYPDNRAVLVWLESLAIGSSLRLRAIVLNRHQRDEIPEEVLQEVAAELVDHLDAGAGDRHPDAVLPGQEGGRPGHLEPLERRGDEGGGAGRRDPPQLQLGEQAEDQP